MSLGRTSIRSAIRARDRPFFPVRAYKSGIGERTSLIALSLFIQKPLPLAVQPILLQKEPKATSISNRMFGDNDVGSVGPAEVTNNRPVVVDDGCEGCLVGRNGIQPECAAPDRLKFGDVNLIGMN